MSSRPFKQLVLDLLRQGRRDEEDFVRELGPAEQAAIGTPELWSAKDHLAHRTFWRRDLIAKVTALLEHGAAIPSDEDEAAINARVFEESRLRAWSEVQAESERVCAELLAVVERLGEDDLTVPGRFSWVSGEWPGYAVFLGDCYEHDQAHLAQYFSDRGDSAGASQILERGAGRVLETEASARVKGFFLYNLARFYAGQGRLEDAATRLRDAVEFNPGLAERAAKDPALAAVR